MKNNNITVQWIKGHSGYHDNDTAKKLARKGTEAFTIRHKIKVPHPPNRLWPTIEEATKNKHSNTWTNLTTCRQTRETLTVLNFCLT